MLGGCLPLLVPEHMAKESDQTGTLPQNKHELSLTFSSAIGNKHEDKELKRPVITKCVDEIASVDDALDYLRVRMQEGETRVNKNEVKKVIKVDLFSDNSSILGDRWYDNNQKDDCDFKFEITSAVKNIEFPMFAMD